MLLVSILAAAGAVVACNAVLGIEEQGTRVVTDAGPADAADGSARPAFEACARDVDCVAPNGCYTPHCDAVLGACTYALCEAPGQTCSKGTCNTKTGACSDPLPYGFLATTYDVPGVTSGCGPKPETCVAAAFPYVFVGTRTDVVALRTDDLTAKEPTKVALSGVGTAPKQVIASGRRIWVLGDVLGEAPPYALSISSIDVPSDPTVTELHAQTVVVKYPYPTAVGFAAPSGGLFVAFNDQTQGFPTALLPTPVAEGADLGVGSAVGPGAFDASAPNVAGMITMVRVGNVPAGSTIVAASGSRLVLWRYPSTFNLVTGAGTPAAVMLAGDLALNPALGPIGKTLFAQGPDGSVMMTAPVVADGPLPDCNCSSHSRLQYVFPNAVATTTDANQLLDPEAFTNPQIAGAACHACSGDYFRPPTLATWLDRRSVLTASPFSGGPMARTVTDVRLLGRDPLEGNPKRRFQTKATDTPKGDFAVDRIALTSSNGLGYLVRADGQGNDVTLSIVDPRCDLSPE